MRVGSRGAQLFVVLIFCFVFLPYPGVVSAYDNLTTHPALTQEVVDFYNNGGNSITAEEKEWIIQGSVEEDTPPRWLNHFYDPISGQGWTGENTGELPSSFVLEFSDLFLAPADPVSAVHWVNDELTQLEYGRYGGDWTWKRGLRYFADGDKKDAYIALGHTLHLLEDMAVPEHTRNDTHVDLGGVAGEYGSPYEEYATKWTRTTIGDLHIVDALRAENATPPAKTSIEDYLISVAQYSNKYFFSKDTINSAKYSLPKIVRDDGNFGYGIDENETEFPLVKVHQTKDANNNILTGYSIENLQDYHPVLDAYFSHLARQAVLNGAGAIALFQKQAQDAVVNKDFQFQTVNEDVVKPVVSGFSLYGEFVQAANTVGSFIGNAFSTVGGWFGSGGALIADAFGTITGPNEITIVPELTTSDIVNSGNNATSGHPTSENCVNVGDVGCPSIGATNSTQHSNILENVGMLSSTVVGDVPAQSSSQEELAAALGRLVELLRGRFAASVAPTSTQIAPVAGGGSALLTASGGGNSPGGVSIVLADAGGASTAGSQTDSTSSSQTDSTNSASSTDSQQAGSGQASSTDSGQATSTDSSQQNSSSGETTSTGSGIAVLLADVPSSMFAQRVDSTVSIGSDYSDSWYELGTGFSGTIHSLTFYGYADIIRPDFASHIWLDEFNDPGYASSSNHWVISDNAPFGTSAGYVTIGGLNITLSPDKYYRLDTYQSEQNRNVYLLGTSSTGTAMRNWFSYGTGRVEELYTFYPYIVADKPVLNISSLAQYQPDGTTAIGEGDEISGDAVALGAVPQSSPEGHLQLEAQMFTTVSQGAWFSNPVVDAAGSFVASGGTATVAVKLPRNGFYHWRARAVNIWGDTSDWLEFGTPGNTDFTALHVYPTPPPSQTVFDASTTLPMSVGCENVTGDGSVISNVRVKYKTADAGNNPRFIIETPLYPDDYNNCTGKDSPASAGADNLYDSDWHDINFTFPSTTLELGKRYLYLFMCTNTGCYFGGSASDTYSGGNWLSGSGIEDAYFTSDGVVQQ